MFQILQFPGGRLERDPCALAHSHNEPLTCLRVAPRSRCLRKIFALVPDCHAEMAYYTRLWQRHFYLGLAGATERLVTPQSTDFNWARRDPGGDKASVTPNRSNVSQLIWEQICNAHRRHG